MNERSPGRGQDQVRRRDLDNWSDRSGADRSSADRSGASVFGAPPAGAASTAQPWPPAPTDWTWPPGQDTATSPLQRTALWPDPVVPESGRPGPYGPDTARHGGAYAPDRAVGGGAYSPDADGFRGVDDWRRAAGSPRGDDAVGRRGGLRFPIGLGALIAGAGAAAVVAALVSLPWFTAADEDVTLADIRTGFDVPATDPADVVPDAGQETGSTLPDGVPTPGEVTDAAEQQARDAAGIVAAAAIDGGKRRYLELYTEKLWLGVAGVAVAAAVLGTLLAPRSRALSLVLGVRRLAGLATVLAGVAHGAAVWIVFFSGDGAPTPAYGVWLGVGGLAAVLLGCIIGPRRASA